MSSTKSNNNDWRIEKLLWLAQSSGRSCFELFIGAWRGDIKVLPGLWVAAVLFWISLFGLDGRILRFLGYEKIYEWRFYGFCWFLLSVALVLKYVVIKSYIRSKFISTLKASFDRCGLRNALKEYPSVVALECTDSGVMRLKLTNAGFGISEWVSKQERLEANLKVYIDQIKAIGEKGLIEITFSNLAMPKTVLMGNIEQYKGFKVFVGQDRTQKYELDFKESPHLLLAGKSGGGKSFFLRQILTTIKVNQPETDIYIVDLKEGVSFLEFKGIKHIQVDREVHEVPNVVKGVLTKLDNRLVALRHSGFSDIANYHASDKFKQKNEAERLSDPLGCRLFFVIDEFAEIIVHNGLLTSEQVRSIKDGFSKIARQGRAVGVHLILCTQRPDRTVIEGQVRTNMSSAICFPVHDMGGSLAVLGSKSGCELPEIKGRAIFQVGSKDIEVQTPLLDAEEIVRYLEPFKVKEVAIAKLNDA